MSEPTKEELYERAQELDIQGRSTMDKDELAAAVAAAEAESEKIDVDEVEPDPEFTPLTTDEPDHVTTSTTPETFDAEDYDYVEVVEDQTDFQAAAAVENDAFEVTQEFPAGAPPLVFITGEEDDSATFGATQPKRWKVEDNEHVQGPPYVDQQEPKTAYEIPDPRKTGAGLY